MAPSTPKSHSITTPRTTPNSKTTREHHSKVSPYKKDTPLLRQMSRPPQWQIRRILGERTVRNTKQYLVEWTPSWSDAYLVNKGKDIRQDWENAKTTKKPSSMVFEFGDSIMLRDCAATENDHEEMQRLMFEIVLTMLKKELGINEDENGGVIRQDRGGELINEKQWKFTNADKAEATRIARLRGDTVATAGKLLVKSYRQVIEQMVEGAQEWTNIELALPYGGVHIQFTGQIDEKMAEQNNISVRPRKSISAILEPLFFSEFATIGPDAMTDKSACKRVAHSLHHRLRHVCKAAPFLLQNPWALLFARLFVSSDEMMLLLNGKARINVSDDWPDRSRDYLMHVYRNEPEAQEYRAPHDIQETYFTLRDFFKDVRVPVKIRGVDGEYGDEDVGESVERRQGKEAQEAPNYSEETGRLEDQISGNQDREWIDEDGLEGADEELDIEEQDQNGEDVEVDMDIENDGL